MVNTKSYISPLVASHFKDASQERSLSALYRMLVIKYSFNCFLKAGRVLVSRIVAGRLFQVRGPATSKARPPIFVFVLGTKTSDDFDDRSRDLLQSSDSGLILSATDTICATILQ